ncbi:T9SS type A sorting domain-containing protein [Flavobacterium sp.]|uniref:T9SS type A sorting domain-containing protein n=1 Tax=Flavobacterium sp. TaxID=239 RepID=UPI0022C761DE|nr:T9SS type A sorting domain-containing protein [Flavobacterium sp.]MCZ8143788.1 T9SS type A sorting domain-containing protein [Flavobacterium sp.]MCZ8367435.1 T9SS type A sorting domain-containing protein [Flavobacterium sp.]
MERKLRLLFVLFTGILSGWSQNDECANAIELTPANTCNAVSGSFNGATRTTPQPTCASTASQDVWYRFTATQATMSVTVVPAGGLNVAFEVLEGSCTGTSVVCIGQFGGGSTESYFGNIFTPGTPYFIRVMNASSGTSTAGFTVCVQQFAPSANDECANAVTLTPALTCNATSGTFSGSSRTTAAPACATTASQDVWYRFVATDPTMSVTVVPNGNVNVAFDVLDGSCTGTSVACIGQFGGGSTESYFNNNFVVGNTYFVRVLNASAGLATNAFTICVQNYPTPANDECANAVTLTPALTCNATSGTFSGSSRTTTAPACATTASQDVWYRFVATDPTMSVTVVPNGNVNVAFDVLDSSCTGTSVACISQFGSGSTESYFNNNFVVGNTYFVRVLNASAGLATNAFTICVQNYPTPANDECANAVTLTPALTCNATSGTFSGSSRTTPAPTCASASNQDVWYSFTATDSSNRITVVPLNNLNVAFEVYSGSCTGTVFSCIGQFGAGSTETLLASNFVVGTTYYIRVLHSSASLVTGGFTICVQNIPTQPNDLCANAITLTPSPTCNATSGAFNGATLSTAAPACANTASQDVWYQFTATDPTMSVSVGPNSSLNVGFEIFAGSCTGTSIACVSQTSTGVSEFFVNSNFVVGTTYFVRVFNVSAALSTLNFVICVQNYPQPANDACANAQVLTPSNLCNPTSGTMSGALFSGPAAACVPTSPHDVWYQFTATDPTMGITVTPLNNLNVAFEVYSGSCTGTLLGCFNNGGSGATETFLNSTFEVGSVYYVRVLSATAQINTAGFTICIQNYPTPANNTCANALVLTPAETCVATSATFAGSTLNGGVSTCAPNAGQDLWFQFTATAPTMSVSVGPSTNLNVAFEIYSNSCTGTLVACQNQTGSSVSEFYVDTNFVVGTTYYVRVLNTTASLSTLGFVICVQNYPQPANDACANAQVLTSSTSCALTTGTFNGATATGAIPSCVTSSIQDVWYQFTATQATTSITVNPGNNFNVVLEVFEGSCTGTAIACINTVGNGASEVYLNNNFVPGNVYFVRVASATNGVITSTFTICVQGFPQPANDACANATPITPSNACNGPVVSLAGATIEAPAPTCAATASQDVWYSFVAPLSSMTVQISGGTGVNHGFQVYETSCSGSVINCMSQAGTSATEIVNLNNLTVGATYLIRVFNVNAALTTAANFVVCVYNNALTVGEIALADLRLFPNPVQTELTWTAPVDFSAYTIVNALGQTVRQGTLTGASLDVADLPQGTYWIRLSDTTQSVVRPFVKK